jgi:hypothetical protein
MSGPIGLELEFDGELLVPRINWAAYRQIYTLEGWLRRICLAAWMGRFGSDWKEEIDSNLRKSLESRVGRNQQRLYLGAESHDDLIWQATHSELLRLLVAESVVTSIRSLTGVDSDFLKYKLNEIREIRNLLAHNRALSSRTHVILSGALASLEEAVDMFKTEILYGPSDIIDDEIWAESGNKPFQAFIARRGSFIEYVCLPVEHPGRWPDARLLLHAYRDHLDDIVAFCLNKTGDEFLVLTPSALVDESRHSLRNTFAGNPHVWTNVPFESQQPRFVCSPKIWFYENRSPLSVMPF